MGTYYYFHCKKCNKRSEGMFTYDGKDRGFSDIIDCFQFVIKHTDQCGHKDIGIMSEHDAAFHILSDTKIDSDDDLYDYFPHSPEWKGVSYWKDKSE